MKHHILNILLGAVILGAIVVFLIGAVTIPLLGQIVTGAIVTAMFLVVSWCLGLAFRG